MSCGSIWTLHHIWASCQDCDWKKAQHGPQDGDGTQILEAARKHSRQHGHYVQVERGQHAHYDFAHTAEGAAPTTPSSTPKPLPPHKEKGSSA